MKRILRRRRRKITSRSKRPLKRLRKVFRRKRVSGVSRAKRVASASTPGSESTSSTVRGYAKPVSKLLWQTAKISFNWTVPVFSVPMPSIDLATSYGTWYDQYKGQNINTFFHGKTAVPQTYNGAVEGVYADFVDSSIFPQSTYAAIADFMYLNSVNLDPAQNPAAPNFFVGAFPPLLTHGEQNLLGSSYYIKDVTAVVSFTNATNFATDVVLYEYIAREDIRYAFSNVHNSLYDAHCSTALGAWSSGTFRLNTTPSDTSTFSSFNLPPNVGSTPFDSRAFTTMYKVIKSTKVKLGPGSTHTHTFTHHVNRKLNPFHLLLANAQIRNLTSGCLLKAVGQPVRVGSVGKASIDVVGTAPVHLLTSMQCTYLLGRSSTSQDDVVIQGNGQTVMPSMNRLTGDISGTHQNLASCTAMGDSSYVAQTGVEI